MTKARQASPAARVRDLYGERRVLLSGYHLLNSGVPWCRGPGTWGHQEPSCDGCATRKLCEWKAAQVTAEIVRIRAASRRPADPGGRLF